MGSGIENTNNGGETQDRTGDTRIFNPLLYLLSYHAEVGVLNNVYKKTSSNFRVFCNKWLFLNHSHIEIEALSDVIYQYAPSNDESRRSPVQKF